MPGLTGFISEIRAILSFLIIFRARGSSFLPSYSPLTFLQHYGEPRSSKFAVILRLALVLCTPKPGQELEEVTADQRLVIACKQTAPLKILRGMILRDSFPETEFDSIHE